MCSTTGGELGRICRAIDELAARSTSGDGTSRGAVPDTSADGREGSDTVAESGADTGCEPGTEPRADTVAESGAVSKQSGVGAVTWFTEPATDDTAARLAAIWEMVADADPELAKRLPGYLTAGD